MISLLNPIEFAYQAIRAARPLHWIKNLAVFTALIFSGNLFSKTHLVTSFIAFWSFNFAASASYIINDIKDIPYDRIHPIKKERPIPAGKISLVSALILSLIFAITSTVLAQKINQPFLFLVISYLVLQIFYSLILKNMAIIDILVIASGFIIRVYAGALAVDAHLSVWFLFCVSSLALFLAAGKRRVELSVIPQKNTRISLSKYKRELLNSYVTMFGNAALLSWSLFTFFESPRPNISLWLFLSEISRATTVSKLLMLTIPLVAFGIMRYESLIFEERAEAPEKLFLTDKALVGSVILWLALIIWIFYGGHTLAF